MHQSERNASPRKDSKPPPFKHKSPGSSSAFPPIAEHIMYKSSTNSLSAVERMGKAPVGIGTRGTVGSLVLQEIEYFRQLEINCRDKSRKKPEPKVAGVGSTVSFSKPNRGSTATMPEKKKGSSRIIPSMCSMVDIVEKKNQPNLRSRFSYRSLEADVKTLQFQLMPSPEL